MKKSKYWLLLLFLIILISIIIGLLHKKNENSIKLNNHDSNTNDSESIQNVIRDKIPSKYKTYTNIEFGFTFQYPDSWTKSSADTKVVNIPGTVAAIEINLVDTITKTTLILEYHFAPNGAELYRFAVSQFNSSQGLYMRSRERIKVGGIMGLKGSVIMNVDGRGHALNPPLRLIVIDFLDKKQTGEIKIKFETPLSDDNLEVAKFEALLSTFKFTN